MAVRMTESEGEAIRREKALKDQAIINPWGEKTRCSNFDNDCWGIECKLSCWLYAPECGVCPFLTGEVVDNTVEDDLH